MSTVVLTDRHMAKKKPPRPAKAASQEPLTGGRIELQAPPTWIARLDAAAEAVGLSRSAYIRLACNNQMKADAQR